VKAVPFEEWLDAWLRAHPEVRDYDKEALRDAFNAGQAFAAHRSHDVTKRS
jgi:hypothetical protein